MESMVLFFSLLLEISIYPRLYFPDLERRLNGRKYTNCQVK